VPCLKQRLGPSVRLQIPTQGPRAPRAVSHGTTWLKVGSLKLCLAVGGPFRGQTSGPNGCRGLSFLVNTPPTGTSGPRSEEHEHVHTLATQHQRAFALPSALCSSPLSASKTSRSTSIFTSACWTCCAAPHDRWAFRVSLILVQDLAERRRPLVADARPSF